MRRDARRNRELLVSAARQLFAEQGVDAPLDDIARRAGVGNATLYRHFPTRGALIEAVFGEGLTGTLRRGEDARHAADAWEGLVHYLEYIFAGLAADRGANDLMTTGIQGIPSLEALKAHHHETVSLLIRRAQNQGTLRGDVVVEDLLFALAALGRVVPASETVAPGAWRRHLLLFLDGLRTEAARPLPVPPLAPEQLAGALRALAAQGPNG
ncbi:TetR family transcriptional regulator [Streptomyces eurocidicus]|uniref:AcrR family transcriptional regulator n=1 Tax=Streptomyces eurocidicus TaxID=66423 RepID=A0A2N8P0P4_STREU|nr:TetR/AcrR family transcriptional regulator [Streptomyces eurocidicus]MBB5122091.1 AcrR family transcriptional regulator [Streptomyces eurocidicus]MBF6055422.1 TetR family transcriptional regulator [Streptomyces eurocidicus]PNE34600.1 TetR family transcriptional regulator [Streptomyces eurocidicus]